MTTNASRQSNTVFQPNPSPSNTVGMKEGKLKKQSGKGGILKKWDERFCFIKGLELHYCKKKGDTASEKIIPLNGVDVIDAAPEFKKKKFVFTLYHPISRSYSLQAPTEKDMKEWMSALTDAVPESSTRKIVPLHESVYRNFLRIKSNLQLKIRYAVLTKNFFYFMEPSQTTKSSSGFAIKHAIPLYSLKHTVEPAKKATDLPTLVILQTTRSGETEISLKTFSLPKIHETWVGHLGKITKDLSVTAATNSSNTACSLQYSLEINSVTDSSYTAAVEKSPKLIDQVPKTPPSSHPYGFNISLFSTTYAIAYSYEQLSQLAKDILDSHGTYLIPEFPDKNKKGRFGKSGKNEVNLLNYGFLQSLFREYFSNPELCHSSSMLSFLEISSLYRAVACNDLVFVQWVYEYLSTVSSSSSSSLLAGPDDEVIATSTTTTSNKVDLDQLYYETETILHCLARNPKSNIEIIEFLLDKNINVDTLDSMGKSSLHHFVTQNNLEAIKRLIAKSANVNVKDKSGETPLHYASRLGFSNIVSYLLESGANIQALSNSKQSPLIVATIANQVPIVNTLISNQARLNFLDSKSNTALHYSISNAEGFECAKLLVESNCDVNIANANGNAALAFAVSENRAKIVNLLVKQSKSFLNTPNNNGNTPLLIAVKKNYLDLIPILSSRHLDDYVTETNHTSTTTSTTSTSTEYQYFNPSSKTTVAEEIAAEQKSNDEEIEAADDNIRTDTRAAERAAKLKNIVAERDGGNISQQFSIDRAFFDAEKIEIADLDLNLPEFNWQNKVGQSCLHIACSLKDDKQALKLVKVLLASEIDPELVDIHGKTALHLAASNNLELVTKALLEYGANVDALDIYGNIPLHFALVSKNDQTVFPLLAEAGSNLSALNQEGLASIHLAVKYGLIDALRLLLYIGTDINMTTIKGQVALHQLGSSKDKKLVQLLLRQKRIDVNSSTPGSKQTPLHMACIHNNVLVASYLLHKEAEVNAKDGSGDTPLHIAVSNKNVEMVKLLVSYNADLEASNESDQTPFALVVEGASKFKKHPLDSLLVARVACDNCQTKNAIPASKATGSCSECKKPILVQNVALSAEFAMANGSKPHPSLDMGDAKDDKPECLERLKNHNLKVVKKRKKKVKKKNAPINIDSFIHSWQRDPENDPFTGNTWSSPKLVSTWLLLIQALVSNNADDVAKYHKEFNLVALSSVPEEEDDETLFDFDATDPLSTFNINMGHDSFSTYHLASCISNVETFKALLNPKPAHISAPETENNFFSSMTPLETAILFKNNSLLELLHEMYPPKSRIVNPNEWTPLHIAHLVDNNAAITLLSSNVDMSKSLDQNGHSPLLYSTAQDQSQQDTSSMTPSQLQAHKEHQLLVSNLVIWKLHCAQIHEFIKTITSSKPPSAPCSSPHLISFRVGKNLKNRIKDIAMAQDRQWDPLNEASASLSFGRTYVITDENSNSNSIKLFFSPSTLYAKYDVLQSSIKSLSKLTDHTYITLPKRSFMTLGAIGVINPQNKDGSIGDMLPDTIGYNLDSDTINSVVVSKQSTRLSWLMDIASGLQWLHKFADESSDPQPVVHGGLNLNNILFGTSLSLTDFGFSQWSESPIFSSWHWGQRAIGMACYLAPEQLIVGNTKNLATQPSKWVRSRNDSEIIFQVAPGSIEADIYAFGIIALQIIHGKNYNPYNCDLSESNHRPSYKSIVSSGKGDISAPSGSIGEDEFGHKHMRIQYSRLLESRLMLKPTVQVPSNYGDWDTGLFDIINRCVNSDPSKRPTTDDLVKTLGSIIDGF